MTYHVFAHGVVMLDVERGGVDVVVGQRRFLLLSLACGGGAR